MAEDIKQSCQGWLFGFVCSLDWQIMQFFLLPVFSSFIVCIPNLLFLFWTERKKRENCCWMVLSVFPARSVEMSPLPSSAGEEHISTVCDYTVFSTFNFVRADFIFVGCETLLSAVQRNAGRKDGYYALRKQNLVSRSCPPGPFSLGCQSKKTTCVDWIAERCEKNHCWKEQKKKKGYKQRNEVWTYIFQRYVRSIMVNLYHSQGNIATCWISSGLDIP